MVIATWLYIEPEGEESRYPQVGGRSSSGTFQDTYWRCVATSMSTSLRNNPEARHVVFSNAAAVPVVDGIDLGAFLDELGVEVIPLDNTHVPPQGFYGAWRSQFYVFDILRYLADDGTIGENETCLVLDSDCVWIDAAPGIERAVQREGALTYTVDEHPEADINGVSRKDLQRLYEELLGEPVPDTPLYCGGEIIAATKDSCGTLAMAVPELWRELLDRHDRGATKFNEEAHVLSYLYYRLGYSFGTANPFIKRVWTNLPFRYRTDLPNDYGLTIWHLPTEKRWGFRRILPEVADRTSAFWSVAPGVPFADYLGHHFGVDRRRVGKSIRDAWEVLVRTSRIRRW